LSEESKPQSWWQTLPGILTAMAAIITAIAALVTALAQHQKVPSLQFQVLLHLKPLNVLLLQFQFLLRLKHLNVLLPHFQVYFLLLQVKVLLLLELQLLFQLQLRLIFLECGSARNVIPVSSNSPSAPFAVKPMGRITGFYND
jgi:hypothetical protein